MYSVFCWLTDCLQVQRSAGVGVPVARCETSRIKSIYADGSDDDWRALGIVAGSEDAA